MKRPRARKPTIPSKNGHKTPKKLPEITTTMLRETLQRSLYDAMIQLLPKALAAAKRGRPALLRLISRSTPRSTATEEAPTDDDTTIIADVPRPDHQGKGEPFIFTREHCLETAEKLRRAKKEETAEVWTRMADDYKPASEGGGESDQKKARTAQRTADEQAHRVQRDAPRTPIRLPIAGAPAPQEFFSVNRPATLEGPPLNRQRPRRR